MCLVSIIVPVYNVEKYLPTCIESLQAQTLHDIEIFLIDDGSQDSSSKICDDYASRDSRVHVVHRKNGGLSSARNLGLEVASGSFICFVDGDDYVAPEYCQSLLLLLQENNCDFSVCGTIRFADGAEAESQENPISTSVLSNGDFLLAQLEKHSEFGACNKMYRRDRIQTLRFASGKLNDDVIWSADLAENLQNGVAVTNCPYYYYRQRQGSIMAEQSIKGSTDFIWAGQYLLEMVRRKFPDLEGKCLNYALAYPWSFVDRIYVQRTFTQNKVFLYALQNLLHENSSQYKALELLPLIIRRRMALFEKSSALYGLNAYARLFRVYLFHLLGLDAYADGHGI